MATVNKDFKIKSGLIVEGTTATVNGYDVLTKKQADQDYIVDLIGGTADSANVANAVVKRDASGNFAAGTITADVTGDVTGDLTGNVTGNVTGTVSSLSNHDTADLAEGTNLYFTNQRALDATAAAYDAAGAAATAQGNAEDYADGLAGNYDAAGAAGAVASDLSDHVSDTSAHGVTGNVVGTSDTQTLTNKTIGDTLNFTGAGAMTINSDSHIVLTPASGSSVKWGSDILATQTYADQAQTDAEAYADGLASNYDAAGAAAQALTDANSYTDGEIAALVDSAPAMLDTLGELATALQENPDIISDLQDIAAGKQGTLTTGNGIVIDNDLIYIPTSIGSGVSITPSTVEIDRAVVDTWYDASGAAATAEGNANSYTDGEITTALSTAQGYATTAEGNANSYTDGEITTALSTASGYADAAETAANGYTDSAISTEVTNRNSAITSAIDALSTSDIEEGSNLYFTDGRAKTSAADLLTSANLTNITITGTGSGLTITAENGVADSDTDDLTEGTTNLYFTAERAVNALEAVVPNFTAVEVNSVAKQVAATVSAPVAGINQAYGFDPEVYRSAEFLVKVAYGSHTEISKVLLTLDSSDNIAITEYGIVGTNGSASSISADISGGEVRLLATTVNNNSTVTVMGTLLV